MAYKTLAAALEGVSFPVDRRTLVDQIGDRQIEIDTGLVSMRELLSACTEDRYENIDDVAACPNINEALQRKKIG